MVTTAAIPIYQKPRKEAASIKILFSLQTKQNTKRPLNAIC